MSTSEIINDLQARMAALAAPKKKQWWERYMKGVIPFRGVGIPQIRDLLGPWREQCGLADQPLEEQLPVALALFEESVAEDKLAGILYFQLYLNDLPWQRLISEIAGLYNRRLIFDWNTCDWLCVRVLGPALARHGQPFARDLSTWKDSNYLWQARSALVPFVKVAGDARFRSELESVAATLIERPERFAKTAVGWVLRDVSRHDPEFVRDFVTTHARSFSIESARNATKYLDEAVKRDSISRVKRSKSN